MLPSNFSPRAMQRNARKAVGGVRLMTTPIVVTFDQSYKDDEDEEMQDVTILEESKLGDVGPRQGSPAGSRTPWARNEISSQTPWVENGIVSDQEGSELAIGGSRLLNFTARENNEQLNGVASIPQGTSPTRDQALALLNKELATYNYRKQYGSPPPPTKRKGRPRRVTMNNAKPYTRFMAPHLAAKIAEFVGFSDTPLTIEALLIEQKSSDQITESQSIHPSTKGGVEKANLLNISELLSAQQSSEGYSTGFSSYPTLRFKPWEILTFHERIPSIEYNASFRLKLDLFAHVMDWLHLKSKFGIERDAFMTMLKGVIGAVIRRAQLVGPIGVVVRTMRVEGIIQETKTRFSARVVAELATEGDEESSYTENSSPEMLKKEKKKRKNLLANEKEASCLLVWLWVLESVPVKFLSSGDYEVKIEEVRRVFRGEDDQASVSSGAVVLLRD